MKNISVAPLPSDMLSPVPGGAVGLLGGSFDPPHAGHVHISKQALMRFGLSQVWWLVSPGNPLKENGPAPMKQRLAACRNLITDPRIKVTDYEEKVGTRYTTKTLQCLFKDYPQQRFVWLMGADNLASFHHWENWDWILANVPVGVLARPGMRMQARTAPAARTFRRFQIPANQSHRLGRAKAPAWSFVNIPMKNLSSTELRAKGGWSRLPTAHDLP